MDSDFVKGSIRQLGLRETVLDIGGGAPFQGLLKETHLGPTTRYLCMDYSPEGPPNVVGDIHHLPFADAYCEGIVCLAVLEHILEPQRAVDEMYRVLRPGGELFGYVPFLYPYHGAPSDYWRFTEHGVEHLLRNFSEVELERWGDYVHVWFGFSTGFSLAALQHGRWLTRMGHRVMEGALGLRQKRRSGRGRDRLRSLERSALGIYFRAIK